MKVCRVQPDYNTCCDCIDTQIKTGKHKKCVECELDPREYEILQFIYDAFGRAYALVLQDGVVKKIPIKRIYAIREVSRLL